MVKKSQPTFPSVAMQLKALGERIRLARMRRELTGEQFAERVGVSRPTMLRVEAGEPTIAVGTYMRALRVLGLDGDIDLLARDDELGRKLQDLKLKRPRPRGPQAK
ncbi:helix-turn-helix transcriptional regulator [Robbsia sp. KACC 23696]|uniref:helix-turn-helix transcriptional regulator n=1 Tax=Robbsia sp. KACC 23696 TaxID=3149231 RepID=UPI00325BBF3D